MTAQEKVTTLATLNQAIGYLRRCADLETSDELNPIGMSTHAAILLRNLYEVVGVIDEPATEQGDPQ